MQLQCLEVPYSVEKSLEGTMNPKTQIHFPNARYVYPVNRPREVTSFNGCLENNLSARIIYHNFSDLTALEMCQNFERDVYGRNARTRLFSDGGLHCKNKEMDSIKSSSNSTDEGHWFGVLEGDHRASRLPQERLQEKQGRQAFSSSNYAAHSPVSLDTEAFKRKQHTSSTEKPNHQPAAVRVTQRKHRSRKNGWGGTSYVDLITMAIESTAHKRMSLAQIYDWIVKNVPYFKDKERYLSVQGWKVSSKNGRVGIGLLVLYCNGFDSLRADANFLLTLLYLTSSMTTYCSSTDLTQSLNPAECSI